MSRPLDRKHTLVTVAAFCILQSAGCFSAGAQPIAFTYQGALTENGFPANSTNDLTFTLYNADAGGATVGLSNVVDDLVLSNGLFAVTLDFGSGAFDGTALWLEIGVRSGTSVGPYSNLSPRQPITSTPYAIKAANAMTVDMGTISNPSFLGTTTNVPLELMVNNQVGFRLDPPTVGTVANLIGGYSGNTVGSGTEGAVIAGGGTSGWTNTIGADSDYAAIGGGLLNTVGGGSGHATIAGGKFNDIGSNCSGSIIGGGEGNGIANGANNAVVGGGLNNNISMNAGGSLIGGGNANVIGPVSFHASILGGILNEIGGDSPFSAIGGGFSNNIMDSAWHATIPGGWGNTVGSNATYAFSAGRRAKAMHEGAFVWADSQDADFVSTSTNQFLVRASKGLGINSTAPRATLEIQGGSDFDGTDDPGAITFAWRNGGFRHWVRSRHNSAVVGNAIEFYVNTNSLADGSSEPTVGNQLSVVMEPAAVGIARQPAVNALEVEGNASKTTSGSWLANSDRRIKTDIEPVSHALDALNRVKLVSFRYDDAYRAEHPSVENRRYLNVVAQDFAEVFPDHVQSSGERLPDGSHILQVDTHPLIIYSAAAIQELVVELEQKDAKISKMELELAELKELVAAMNHKLNGTAR